MGSGSTGDLFELDTKGICLLCLRNCLANSNNQANNCQIPQPPNSSKSLPPGEKERQSKTWKTLMRYLNIDLLEQCNFSPSFLQSVDGVQREVKMIVKMCSDCLKMCQEFGRVYKQFEKIRLQLDKCVQALYLKMLSGNKDQKRLMEYERILLKGAETSWNPLNLFHASIADNLRKETLRKCKLLL